MKTGCKFCDEMAPNPEQPGLYCLPHSEHVASAAAAAYFAREDERCKREDQALRDELEEDVADREREEWDALSEVY